DAARAIIESRQLLPVTSDGPLLSGLDDHLAAVQERSAPVLEAPVAAPRATHAAAAPRAPTSPRTQAARARLQQQQEREQAAASGRSRNLESGASESSGSPSGGAADLDETR